MNENINLVEILKDCPKGTKLYSTVYGDVEFDGINKREDFPVKFVRSDGDRGSVTAQGLVLACYDGECIIFPSRVQRNWDLFTVPDCKKDKFDPRTLHPFEKVLVRDDRNEKWQCSLFSYININVAIFYPYVAINTGYKYCIPYNDDTKHLVGTTDEAPEYYRYWED